jgi:large subunit ribosomal protein L9
MELILVKDVEKLGFKDDVVKVRDGYGRNFLIPQGYAVLATPSAKKMHEETIRQRSHKEEKVLAEAKSTAEKIAGITLKIGAKVGDNGKIFGSVNTVQLADAFDKAGFKIDRKSISIKGEPIKEVGTYEASVILHKQISQPVKFEVVED